MRNTALCFVFLLFFSCKKFTEEPKEGCFIPYVDFVTHRVDPTSLQVSFDAVVSANGTITSHKWEFGDGTTYNGQNPPPHQYPPLTTPGGSATYKVRYTVANECGEAYWSKDIVISGCLPDTRFSFTHLNDSTVQFTNLTGSSANTNYLWNFGDGTTSTSNAATVTHTYRQDQSFNVSLKATNNCGENNFSAPVLICRSAIPAQTVTVNGCGAVTVTAAATQNGGKYQWNFGNGVTLPAAPSSSSSISYTYPNPGSYTITLSVINAGGCDTTTTSSSVTITGSAVVPNTSWSYNSDDLDFIFSRAAVTNATSYSWNFGDGTTSTQQNPGTKTYSDPGAYTITLSAGNGCGNTHQFSVPVSVPFYRTVANVPNTAFQQVLAISAAQIYYLGTNGKLYKTDTAGNWSGAINLPSNLTFNTSTRLFEDVNGSLWIYGRREVAKFNPAASNWTSYFSSTGFPNNATITSMAIDNTGNLWTIADGRIRRGNTSVNANNNIDFYSLAFAPGNGRIWAVAENTSSIYFINVGSTTVNTVNVTGIIGGAEEIKVHPNGELYFTTGTGIIRTNNTGGVISNYNVLNTGGFLAGRPKTFDFDERGNLWFLYSNKLYKLPVGTSNATKRYSYNADLDNLSWISVLALAGGDHDILVAKNSSSNAAIKIK